MVTYNYGISDDSIQFPDLTNKFTKQTLVLCPNDFIKESITKVNGGFENKFVSVFDTLNNVETITTYDRNDSVSIKIKNWYNEANKITRKLVLDSNYAPINEEIFEYDDKANRVVSRVYFPSRSEYAMKILLLDSLNVSKNFESFINEELGHLPIKFDSNSNNLFYTGCVARSSILTHVCDVYSSEYKYDENKNWIERKDYWNGKLESVTYREIEYYN